MEKTPPQRGPILAGLRLPHNRRTRMAGSNRRGGYMRFAFLILGILAAGGCIGNPAEAAQNYPWCAYYDLGTAGFRHCGFATLQQCLNDVGGLVEIVVQVRIRSPESRPLTRRPRHHSR